MQALTQIVVIPEIHARRATRTEEKEESASHHGYISIIFAFCSAQLRAENVYRDVLRPQETTGKREERIF